MYNWKTVLITLGVLVGLKIWSPYLVDNIKWSYFDVLHQQKGEKLIEDIVLVDIDEKSLDKYGQYPWPRNIYADIMLDSHYTNTHVFTQVFNQPDRFGGDEQIAGGLPGDSMTFIRETERVRYNKIRKGLKEGD